MTVTMYKHMLFLYLNEYIIAVCILQVVTCCLFNEVLKQCEWCNSSSSTPTSLFLF